MNVFVYGTLLSGQGNNFLLKEAQKLGDAEVRGFQMLSLGSFPACVPTHNPDHRIVGEVWEITDDIFSGLDRLEGYPHFYDRVEVNTPWGDAWMYVQDRPVDPARVIVNGDWREFVRESDGD